MYSCKLPEKEKPSADSHSLIPDSVLERLQTPFGIESYDVRLVRRGPMIGDRLVTLTLRTDVLRHRLTSLVGHLQWQADYQTNTSGNTVCNLTIMGTQRMGLSSHSCEAGRDEALRRAAAQFGIGPHEPHECVVVMSEDELGYENRKLQAYLDELEAAIAGESSK